MAVRTRRSGALRAGEEAGAVPIVRGMPDLRPMREDDIPAVRDLAAEAFEDLDRRQHVAVGPRPEPEAAYVRNRRLLATDPDGCWVADGDDGALAGVTLAIMRDGLWGLSLLAVRPGLQSGGVGGALLNRALAYGNGARGGIVLSSSDPRALRAYASAGFTMHPTAIAHGVPRGVEPAPEVRAFTDADHAMAAAVDRAVRGAAHGADLDALAEAGCERLAFPGRGYAVHHRGELKVLAAADEDAAAALLRTVLARTPNGAKAEIEWLTAAQQWATDVAVAARLELRPSGALFLRGETGAFRPYLPSGAYL
jgi:GNAT superfamily N-acetyltransferase